MRTAVNVLQRMRLKLIQRRRQVARGRLRRGHAGLRAIRTLLPAALLILLAGCDREQIRVYEIPKAQSTTPASPVEGEGGLPPLPQLAWKGLPSGWSSKPGAGMRAATFEIQDAEGGRAELAAIPLPGMGGNDVELVNLWRQQVGLQPVTKEDVGRHAEEFDAAGRRVRLYTISGEGEAGSTSQVRLLVASVREAGFTWFFKLAGDPGAVSAQRENLKQFVSQAEFVPPPMDGLASAGPSRPAEIGAARFASAQAPARLPRWQVPAGWEAQPPTSMVLARWIIAGEAGARAEVTVSAFPGDVGGVLANVNRWRRQVSLPAISEAELPGLIESHDAPAGPTTVVDLRGTDAKPGQADRLIAAMTRQGGETWFYKLMGDTRVAETQKAAFLEFVKSAQYR